MDRFKNFLKSLKMYHNDLKGAIMPTIVIACIFFINYFFFGIENTIIGPCLTLSYLYFRGLSNHVASLMKNFLIYLIVAALAWVAGINLPLTVIANAFAFFWIIYQLNDEFHPTNYFAPGMAFILFQLSPVHGVSGILTRGEALAASFAITFIVLLVIPAKKNKYTVRNEVQMGLSISRELLGAYEAGDREQVLLLQEKLRQKNEKISDEIYLHNYASIVRNRKVNWYCRFVALFQVFTTLTDEKDVKEKSVIMENLLNNFSSLFEIGEQFGDKSRLYFKNKKLDIRSFQLRFALRQVIVMTPCMIYAFLCPWGNGYWLPLLVFFMLDPLYENLSSRVSGSIKGTLVGVLLCFVLFSVFPNQNQHIAIMMIFNFLSYSTTGYAASIAYITGAVLALNVTEANIIFALTERLVYTFGGAFLTMFAGKFIFPIRIRPEAEFLYEKLMELEQQVQRVRAEDYESAEARRHDKDQLLIRSYLLARRLRLYNESLREEDRDQNLMLQLNQHMLHMSYYLVHHFIGIKVGVQDRT